MADFNGREFGSAAYAMRTPLRATSRVAQQLCGPLLREPTRPPGDRGHEFGASRARLPLRINRS